MIITISSLKGGVGKTTLTAFLAQALKAMGKSVLVVDLDHNNNLTDFFLRDDGPSLEGIEAHNIRHVLTGKQKIFSLGPNLTCGPVWHTPEKIDIIPATPSLAQIGYELAHDPGAVLRFRKAIHDVLTKEVTIPTRDGELQKIMEGYDVVLIDTPPALTLELSAGLYAADIVLVPLSTSRWVVQGYQVIEAEVVKIGDTLGKAPRMLAVPSMVSDSEADAMRGLDYWRATQTTIHRNQAIRAAASEGRALRADTIGARAFESLAAEVVG